MTALESLQNNLPILRKNKEITQEDLTGLSGVSTRAISNIERGAADPKLSTLEKLALGLEVDIARLLTVSTETEAEADKQCDFSTV